MDRLFNVRRNVGMVSNLRIARPWLEVKDLTAAHDFSPLRSGLSLSHIEVRGTDVDKVVTSLSIIRNRVKAGDKLPVHLAPGGGLAVFTPAVKTAE
ncbi:MAG: hypothetical protein ABSF71_38530 [Terriglobia bacterium]